MMSLLGRVLAGRVLVDSRRGSTIDQLFFLTQQRSMLLRAGLVSESFGRLTACDAEIDSLLEELWEQMQVSRGAEPSTRSWNSREAVE